MMQIGKVVGELIIRSAEFASVRRPPRDVALEQGGARLPDSQIESERVAARALQNIFKVPSNVQLLSTL